MVDTRYDLVLRDPGATSPAGDVSIDSQGIIADGGIRWDSASPMATRITEAIDYQSFDQFSVIEQSDFHHGRGLEKWDATNAERFYDSYNVDTRIRDQVTLAPLVTTAGLTGSGYPSPGSGPVRETNPLYNSTRVSYLSRLAQSFQVAGTPTLSTIVLWLGWNRESSADWTGTAVTLRLETDSAGSPSGTLVAAGATATVTRTAIGQFPDVREVTFTLATPFVCVAATTYWLVVSHDFSSQTMFWQGTRNVTDAGYTTGVLKGYNDEAWEVTSYPDGFFYLPDVGDLAGTVTCFAQFNGKMYCGAGKAVYVWNNATGVWAASKADFAQNVTDMVDFNSLLWVAQSDGNMWTFNGTSTWTEKSGVTATHLLVYKGYLYRSTYSTDNCVYYTADGAYWPETGSENPWKVGNPGRLERITGLAGYNYEVYALTTHGLYQVGPESERGDLIDQVKSWESQYDTDNGRGGVSWSKDAKLYMPILGGLLSYTEGLLESIGPDQDAGLPADRQGNIVDLLNLTNWLVAAVDAGTSGTSSILVYNGIGWNELVRMPAVGKSCRALGYDTTVSPHRLWFGYGSRTGYITLPDLTDNPYLVTSSRYSVGGSLTTPWISYGLLGVEKDFQEVGLQYVLPESCTITVEYEVDRSGLWTPLFTLLGTGVGNVYTYTFPFGYVAAPVSDIPTTTAGCTTTTINVDTAIYLQNYYWLRINGEVRQMLAYVSDTQITLARPLSVAPAAGVRCYIARACGIEIRFRFTLFADDTDNTPVIKAWWVKAMPMLTDKLAGSFTCDVYDGQLDRAGSVITPDAATRAAQLYSFANRPIPLDLVDRRGTVRRVKVTSIREQEVGVVEGALGQPPQIRSQFSIGVVEL